MRLPQELSEAAQAEVETIDRQRLAQAVTQLTERYKAGEFSSPAIGNDAQRAAYLAVRMPATYAANLRVFSEIQLRAPQAEIASILDLGAGPGTAAFAASQIFPSLQHATLIEADDHWLRIGKKLAERSFSPALRGAEWLRQDLRSGFACDPPDLVVVSYALGELGRHALEAVVRKAWACAKQFLVIMEAGTPRGFATINAARSLLIAGGAGLLAPCPHQHACPMAAGKGFTPEGAEAAHSGDTEASPPERAKAAHSGDWCHFAQRVERSSQHRQLKGGALGYEDEKFSYVIGSRQGSASFGARIVRHPGKHSGHVQLVLCTPQGRLENRTVTRSSGPAYKHARQAEWGDSWPE
jgi:ribosomal protein RSM22 (predicted rRNA methylase)